MSEVATPRKAEGERNPASSPRAGWHAFFGEVEVADHAHLEATTKAHPLGEDR